MANEGYGEGCGHSQVLKVEDCPLSVRSYPYQDKIDVGHITVKNSFIRYDCGTRSADRENGDLQTAVCQL